MTRTNTTEHMPRELAHRTSDGLEVWLGRRRTDGCSCSYTTAAWARAELEVDASSALDAFDHPYCIRRVPRRRVHRPAPPRSDRRDGHLDWPDAAPGTRARGMLARRRRPVTAVTAARMAACGARRGLGSGGVGAIGQRVVPDDPRCHGSTSTPCSERSWSTVRSGTSASTTPTGRSPRSCSSSRSAYARRGAASHGSRPPGRSAPGCSSGWSGSQVWLTQLLLGGRALVGAAPRRLGDGIPRGDFGGWLALGGTFVAVCIALLVDGARALGGLVVVDPGRGGVRTDRGALRLHRPVPHTRPRAAGRSQLIRTYERFERTQGVDVPLRVEEVSGDTSQANALRSA